MSEHAVLILGAGPSGLGAARRLAELGIRDVVILDREGEAGGVPRHCGHPAFGMREFRRLLSGPVYARRLAASVAGLDLRLRTTVTALEPGGCVLTVHPDRGPERLTARAVLIAFGVRETPRSARLIGGDRPAGVTTTGALQQFVYLSKLQPFRRAVVVGSELVAFSALLTLRHAGIKAVAMIEDAGRITARRPADLFARAIFGVPVLIGTRLVAIHGLDKVETIEVERDGSISRIACDGVVFTGRFRPETAILAGGHLAIDPGSGGPAIDQQWRCSDPIYFAAGNLLRPVETAGVAWAEGRAAAESIAASLAGRLASPTTSVPILAQPPLKYVYPQRLSVPAEDASPLLFKARVSKAARGRLRLLADGREIWSETIAALPERRIALPAADFLRGNPTQLKLEFEEG